MSQSRIIQMIIKVGKGEIVLKFTKDEFKGLIESMQEHLKDGIHSLDMFSDAAITLISKIENKN